MTFLNPLYLIALAAAAIPIILHLLNLRKSRIVEFSTLAFLKELQRSKIRKLKIKQWLLLALRTLIVVFMVLAFTRPAFRGSFDFLPGSQAKSSVVIILDDSFSMGASDEGGQLFKQAKEKAASVLDMLRAGDEAAIITLSGAAKETVQFTTALNALRKQLEQTQPSFAHMSLLDGLTAASALLQQSDNFNKEIYILSDEQKSHFTVDAQRKTPLLFDPAVKTFLVRLGTRRIENTAVVDVKVENVLFEQGKPVEISATVLNDGTSAIAGGIVSIFLDGERVAQKSVDVEPGALQHVQFSVTPKASGFVSGFVELEDDGIPEDNRRYFSFFVPNNLRILLGPSGTQEATILTLALQPAPESSSESPLKITGLDRNGMLSANPSNFDVVVLLGGSFVTPSFAQRLRASIEAGTSAFVMPDADGKIEAFSSVLLPALGIPAPSGVNGTPGNTASYVTFANIDFDHPLFKGVFEKTDAQKPAVETPHIFVSAKLHGNEAAFQVIGSSAGDAVLLDRRLGLGRVLVFGISPSLQWSDFPLKGLFVPLMNRSMFYLASREDYSNNGIIGTAIDLLVRGSHGSEAFELLAPSGKSSRIIPKSLSSGLSFTISDLEMPGTYELSAAGNPIRKLSMNIDPAESRMEPAGDKERDALYGSIGIVNPVILTRDSNVSQIVSEARFGVELWKYFILLALVCALAEMLLARDAKRSRAGVDAAHL
jgi:hypothetical protein